MNELIEHWRDHERRIAYLEHVLKNLPVEDPKECRDFTNGNSYRGKWILGLPTGNNAARYIIKTEDGFLETACSSGYDYSYKSIVAWLELFPIPPMPDKVFLQSAATTQAHNL